MLIGLLLSTVMSSATNNHYADGISNIDIKGAKVQNMPKNNSILATINGHQLTVTFLEDLGNVQVEVTTATGGTVDLTDLWTPNSYIAYITNTGSYVVTITLGNGDEYYGEFEVTN